MRVWLAYWKKEWMELVRNGKLLILLLISGLFGLMNPALAKLTPWLMETMAESLQDTGLLVTGVTVDVMTSWTQFYKNMPMALIVVVLMLSGIFIQEYQKGTLILVLTKGLSRQKVYTVKTAVLLLMWFACFWLSFFITWIYNDIYWDNKTASHVVLAAALFCLFGVWVILFVVFFSVVFSEVSGILAGTGIVVVISYVLGIFPRLKNYVPTKLLSSQELLTHAAIPEDFGGAVVVTVLMMAAAGTAGMFLFARKSIK